MVCGVYVCVDVCEIERHTTPVLCHLKHVSCPCVHFTGVFYLVVPPEIDQKSIINQFSWQHSAPYWFDMRPALNYPARDDLPGQTFLSLLVVDGTVVASDATIIAERMNRSPKNLIPICFVACDHSMNQFNVYIGLLRQVCADRKGGGKSINQY